jgi:hypothetical protein
MLVSATMGPLSFAETNILWLSAVSLEVTVLFRGWKAGLLGRYSYFYACIAWFLLRDALCFWAYEWGPNSYQTMYWYTAFVTVAVSCGICFEIFKNALRHSPGVARAAQKLLLTVFVIAFTYVALDVLHNFHGKLGAMGRAAGKSALYLTYLEVGLLLVMLWLFGHYRIPLGRNLLGLIAGFSLWVSADVMLWSWMFLPRNLGLIGLGNLLPITFVIALLIWCVGFWRLQPEPTQPPESALERDYEVLRLNTKAVFAHMFARVHRAFRPR